MSDNFLAKPRKRNLYKRSKEKTVFHTPSIKLQNNLNASLVGQLSEEIELILTFLARNCNWVQTI